MSPEQLQYVQNKVSKVRKSCVTIEQKQTAKIYSQLYREWLDRHEHDFGKQIRSGLAVCLLVAITVMVFMIGIAAIIHNN